MMDWASVLCARRLEQGKFHWAQIHQGETVALQPGTVTGSKSGFALATHWTTASGNNALNQARLFCYSPNVLFHSLHDLRHTGVMNTLPDLSQLTHEQLLEFTRQLALQHQSLAQSNQQLDAKVQHLSILNQKYEHELALFKQHKFGSKNEHLTAKQIHLWDEAVEEKISQPLIWN